ncbi:mediator of RNA polymerase II transcription subunit 30-like [Mya arenaria]|uniref:mediator of RNA polymerase II transcription subunit 30-like n=1 Tax=Mya arenaria TaxID=6604 RepID=UPI0022E7CB14|nr:mediator of RNA polymerase II transcription subunit 30-like [Mya arenaria]XP_052764232.1 mediator of RNA polymerase II transcription subunit 30-like [Mya arenaria]
MAGPGQHYPMSVPASLPSEMIAGSQIGSQGQMFSSQQGPGSHESGLPHQQSFPGASGSSQPPQPPMMSPTKQVNPVSLCKMGQESNQELVTKLLDVFRLFKSMQLPNGTNNAQYHERRTKIDDNLRALQMTFKKLRFIYDKTNQMVPDPDENPEEVLVPLKGDPLVEKNTNTDAFKLASDEHGQLIEQIQLKNHEMKEVIDKIRTIIWEINTMIVMRKT